MVIEGIVLGYKISAVRLEVNQAKVSSIKTLLLPTIVKGIRSFLGHACIRTKNCEDVQGHILCQQNLQ